MIIPENRIYQTGATDLRFQTLYNHWTRNRKNNNMS